MEGEKFRALKLVAAELPGKTVLELVKGPQWHGQVLVFTCVCVGISPDVASGRDSSAELWQWAGLPGLNI